MNHRMIGLASGATVLFLYTVGNSAGPASPREEAYRANNLGVALLEQVKFAEAADAFRKALSVDRTLDIAQINLAIALFNAPDFPAAQREATLAAERAPGRPEPHYMLGLVNKSLNRTEEAIAAFRRVLEIDPDDVGANINLGQLLLQQQKYADAVMALKRASAAEPYNSTAAYSLATALLRSGDRTQGQEQMKRFQALREAGYATSLSQNYPLQGRHAEAIVSTGNEAALVDVQTPAAVFRDATAVVLPTPATKTTKPPAKVDAVLNATLVDHDADGDLDVVAVYRGRARLFENNKGVLSDATASGAFVSAGPPCRAAVAGDYDNDGKPDVLILRELGLRLYRNLGAGKFADVSTASGLPAYAFRPGSAAFVDADHDGDLDILVGGGGSPEKPAPNLLLRNNGQGQFMDVAGEAKIKGPAGTVVAVVPTDYDNHRDVDFLLARDTDAPLLWQNLRDGSFRDVAVEVGLKLAGRISSVAAGDLNKDSYTDFFFGRADGAGFLAQSDGRERFTLVPGPPIAAAASAAQFLDYDNDGLLDLVVLSSRGLRVLRWLGDRFADVTAASVAADLQSAAAGATTFAAGDLDGDGDTDLVIPTAGGLRIARNEGGEKSAALRVVLTGKSSNRNGVGSKVEARAGSLRSKLELYAAVPAPAPADLLFGLGKRTAVDAIRILWPSGTLQAETELPALAPAAAPKTGKRVASRTVEELDRTPSSCPYLFAWNGERFAFVTDFMGGGEMGAWLAPGVRNTPDPDEYVRIGPEHLRERNGRFELRITHELEEVLYVDRLELVSVAHPRDFTYFPNEGLGLKPREFALHAAEALAPPLAAVDEHGHDVLARVRDLDGRAADDFEVAWIRGYAKPHTLTLDLGRDAGSARLFLTGWTEYAFSSDNVAAFQAGLGVELPRLEARAENGRWETIAEDVGYPIGRPQTLIVDLRGKLPRGAHQVRLVTNMRVYWDQIQIATGAPSAPTTLERLVPDTADLRSRGFSAPTRRSGATALDFDYTHVSTTNPWKLMPGAYTRLGDVRPLLVSQDDQFVVAHPGDEIALSFDARALQPLPSGWIRTFLLYVHGYSKEMNLHSASPDVVAPLPYGGMKGYPYPPELAPARDKAYWTYLTDYNTRLVGRSLPRLETLVVDAAD